MFQEKNTNKKIIFYGIVDSDDIEMSLPDVLAYAKRLGNQKKQAASSIVRSDQPSHHVPRKDTFYGITSKGDD